MSTSDEDVVIEFDRTRTNPYRHTIFGKRLKEVGSIRLRFVKVMLPENKVEILATNLSRENFTAQDISTLYGLRWGIETVYDTLKNKFMIENFTGKKSIIIEQDIFSTIYLYNITQDMLRDAEAEQQEKNRGKSYKYRMKVNMNLAIGIIKDELVLLPIYRVQNLTAYDVHNLLRLMAS